MFVNSAAMGAALITILHALLRDFGALPTLKRAAIAYFAFYLVGSLLSLVFRAGIHDEWVREDHERILRKQQEQEETRLKAEAERQAERDRRKEERKKQLIGEAEEKAAEEAATP